MNIPKNSKRILFNNYDITINHNEVIIKKENKIIEQRTTDKIENYINEFIKSILDRANCEIETVILSYPIEENLYE